METASLVAVLTMTEGDFDRVRQNISNLVEHQLAREDAEYAAKLLCDLAMKAKERGFIELRVQINKRGVEVKSDEGRIWAQLGVALATALFGKSSTES